MKVSSILQLSLLALSAAFVFVDSCDIDEVTTCYDTLVHYEALAFPLYGEDEAELNDTCNHINDSFVCIKEFLDQSDEECKKTVAHISSFFNFTGLKNLYRELCIPYKPLRETYMENYDCLESNADEYAVCHNISQISQEYMTTVPSVDQIRDRCCFFSWYQGCFNNITESTCGVNATFFVSLSLHLLVGHMADQLCGSTNITCHEPPMPDEESPDGSLDKDHPDQTENDVDNSLPKASSPVFSCAIVCLIAAQCIIVLSKHLL